MYYMITIKNNYSHFNPPRIFLALNVRDPVARVVSLYSHLKLFSGANLGTVEAFALNAANTMT